MKYLNVHNNVNFTEFLNKLHAYILINFIILALLKIFSSMFSKQDISEL